MVCIVYMTEKPQLNDPVLIEGLPGIGFVANIAALHLLKELNMKKFAKIFSSSFQDFVISTEEGGYRLPINELYYYKGRRGERDAIVLYGNTQALTSRGQYELCGRILDIAQSLGCNYVITMGGLRVDEQVVHPRLRCAATDHETLCNILGMGVEVLTGHIYGAAGLLLGLAKLRGMKGFCVLAETPGFYPDPAAAKEVLKLVCRVLGWELDFSKLDEAAEATKEMLRSMGIVQEEEEKKAFHGLV